MHKNWLAVCLANFLIAALFGSMLRLSRLVPLGFEYSNFLHAHSHVAMLGWVYLVIFGLAVTVFVPDDSRQRFGNLFWVTQGSVIGMMVTFPLQGYAPASITFSTLHILCAYVFAVRVWKFLPRGMFRTALVFMVISTFGAWSLGVVGATLGKESAWYKVAIQFFLHFQFNGWFLIGGIALLHRYLGRLGICPNPRLVHCLGALLAASAVFTFGLPLQWSFGLPVFGVFNAVGAALQLGALMLIAMIFKNVKKHLPPVSQSLAWLMILAGLSLLMKAVFQGLSTWPEIADASLKVRPFAIGFIHLTMLGAVSGILLFLVGQNFPVAQKSFSWKTGTALFCAGFIGTEALIFLQGFHEFARQPQTTFFPVLLLGFTLLLTAGIGFFLAAAANRT